MRSLPVLLLFLACGFAPAAAGAESRPGNVADPAGDAVAGGPDLVGAAIAYDTAGSVTARLTLAPGSPGGASVLGAVVVGTRTGSGGCAPDFAIGGALAAGSSGLWSTADGEQGTPAVAFDGATLTLSASASALAATPDCLRALLQQAGGAQTLYDETAVGDLTVPAPAPSPAPAPNPAPAPAPVPPAPRATALERYDAAVARCPARHGSARSRCLRRARTANRAGARIAAKRATNPFLGKAFFRPDVDPAFVCGGTCLAGWTFVDDRWAHRGRPEDGPLLVRCRRTTAKGDEDGCLRYRLARDHRTALAGGVRLRLARDGRSITASDEPKRPLTRVAVPRAGLRIAGQLDNITTYGIPGVSGVTSTDEVSFSRDGRFTSESAVAGQTFDTTFTALPPGKRGHYAFEPGGTLARSYDSGRVLRESAFVAFGRGRGLGDPVRDGLFLNGFPYLAPDD